MRSLFPVLLALPSLLLALPVAAAELRQFRADWHIGLEAGVDYATVRLELEDDSPLRRVNLRFSEERFSDFSATGELEFTAQGATWVPPARDAALSYRVQITRERPNRNQALSYDARMTDDWALFRGDRLTPRMRVSALPGASAETVVHFDLPEGWTVSTGWPLLEGTEEGQVYRVDEPERVLDRPSGWVIAGKIRSRRTYIGDTYFSVSAPLNSQADRMGWLTLVSLVYPEIEKAFVKTPEKILMVSGDDPLWRGGLSGPNSFYFHSSRRAISENGTSPLLHELTHVITRISGDEDEDDWIAEGLAEYYGIELLRRAGGITADKKQEILARLAEWAQEAPSLLVPQSTGPVTARAVVLFDALDREIGEHTDGDADIDEVTRLLMEQREVTLPDLQAAFRRVTGTDSAVLASVE